VVGVVAARGVYLEGDEQADRKTHGGPDKAIYLGLLPREYSVLGQNLSTFRKSSGASTCRGRLTVVAAVDRSIDTARRIW
jgi:hypothetical protein